MINKRELDGRKSANNDGRKREENGNPRAVPLSPLGSAASIRKAIDPRRRGQG